MEKLALEKNRKADFELYSMIDRLAPQVIAERRRIYKGVSPNVDFYSGFVYSMLDIPPELYTPIFAMARIVGWSAHMMEERTNADKIIRPAYKSVSDIVPYVPLGERLTWRTGCILICFLFLCILRIQKIGKDFYTYAYKSRD